MADCQSDHVDRFRFYLQCDVQVVGAAIALNLQVLLHTQRRAQGGWGQFQAEAGLRLLRRGRASCQQHGACSNGKAARHRVKHS